VSTDAVGADVLSAYALRLADDRLVLGHRLSEWCGHGPILEEDIALANMALDLIGQATALLGVAASELGGDAGDATSADSLAYGREAVDYKNVLMVELPKGDFGFTIVRQFLYSAFGLLQMERLASSSNADLAGIASKAVKEGKYHVRHAGEWVLTLGGGTDESHARAQAALDDLWRYTGEFFVADGVEQAAAAGGVGVNVSTLEQPWRAIVEPVLTRAGLAIPEVRAMQRGGRAGRHTEHLGHMLAEMQIVARSFPGASW
jgi:ring-1,2-phenylacetyl-CoA epoxidase subunit PaaC